MSSHVGVFFVKKKDPNAIRMVIDCRGTTQLCQDPPTTRLGSSRCYAGLRLDRSHETGGAGAWGREADVNDCFYRFSFLELAHYFGINHPLTALEWRALGLKFDSIYDPCTRHAVGVDEHTVLYPCFRAVPMGWSWALFLCHEAALQIARPGSPWNDGILREERATPQLSEYNTLLGVYVDNITVIGKNQDELDQRCQVLEAAFKDADNLDTTHFGDQAGKCWVRFGF